MQMEIKMTIGRFREIILNNTEYRQECLEYRKSLEERWDYNAVAGILIGSRIRHTTGVLHFLEQNIGIGQGDNGNHVVLKLKEKGLEEIFLKYEKDTEAELMQVEFDILYNAPEYKDIISFINDKFLKSALMRKAISNHNKFISNHNDEKKLNVVDVNKTNATGYEVIEKRVKAEEAQKSNESPGLVCGKYDRNSKYCGFFKSGVTADSWNDGTRCNYIEYDGYVYFMNYKRIIDRKVDSSHKYDVIIGRISLKNYKVEILKEYSSAIWKYSKGNYNKIRNENLFSISHGKIWYIAYENDDVNNGGSDKLAIKCLDIKTGIEHILMDLPAGYKGARFPIVQGNSLIFLEKKVPGGISVSDNKLIIYDLRTLKKVTYKKAADIIAYNNEYIFFSKDKRGTFVVSSIFAVNTATQEIIALKDMIPMLANKMISKVYYIDCYNNEIYLEYEKKLWRVSFGGSATEIAGYKIEHSYDGRFGDYSFNGKVYITVKNGDTQVSWYKPSSIYEKDYYLSEIDENGKIIYERIDFSPDDNCNLTTLCAAGGIVICNLSENNTWLKHQGSWHKIFG